MAEVIAMNRGVWTWVFLINFVVIVILCLYEKEKASPLKLFALTIASHETDGINRLRRSAATYGINLQVFIEPSWIPENDKLDVIKKVKYTRNRIEEMKNDYSVVVLFVDAFDVLFNAGEEEIMSKFLEFDANLVFGAEVNYICESDKERLFGNISDKQRKYKFLNSGTIIGYAPYLYQLYSFDINEDVENDQCWITNHFLDPEIRNEMKMKLDYDQNLFQTLYQTEDDFDLEFSEDDARLVNTLYNTRPSILHGNGYSGKKTIKQYENYIAKSWTPEKGCMKCSEGRIDLNNTLKSNYPLVLLGMFVKEETPFLEDMLLKVVQQSYPKEKIIVYVFNNVYSHETQINEWILSQRTNYSRMDYTSSFENVTHRQAKQLALKKCSEYLCDVFFNVESEVHLENPETLTLLISYNRSILAPVMSEDISLHSTFWGDLEGKNYKRSFDYVDIVNYVRRGIWNTQCVYSVYVMWRYAFENPKRMIGYSFPYGDYSIFKSFCLNNRYYITENFMYAVNLENFGHLVALENKEGSRTNVLQSQMNPTAWQSRYIHPNYFNVLNNKITIEQVFLRPHSNSSQFLDAKKCDGFAIVSRVYDSNIFLFVFKPCSDVFNFPVFKEEFGKDILNLMRRDIVPTLDDENEVSENSHNEVNEVKLSEVRFESHWKHIAKKFIEPVIKMIFTGYSVKGNPTSSFIRIIKPVNQSINPNMDLSIYTVVISLNTPDVDYLGGGTKFFRTRGKECVVPPLDNGWVTVYPGKPTHYHQEVPVSVGFKYDLIYYAD